MISEDKTGLLKAFLGSLPGEIAARLAGAVEADRLLDGKALPHDAILEGLRPILRCAHAARTPTPLRLFCRPFEDLLTSDARKTKQKASIARSSLLPIWLWLGRDLMPAQTEAYITESKALIMAHKYSEATRCAERFWTEAGSALQAGLAAPAARTVLGDALILADAQEMALLLPAGTDMLRIQDVLLRPVPQLNEELLWQLRAVYDDLVVRLPDVAPYVAVMAMNRLAHPWEALRLPMQICRQGNDTLISQTDMGLVGEIIFARMESLRDAILTTRHPLFSAETLMAQMSQFTAMSSAIVKEIELKRDGEWGQRLLKDRAQTGAVMDVFMDRAMREISVAMPVQKSTGGMADFGRAANAEKREMALRYARLVVGSRNFAAAGSFAAKQKTVYEEICAYLRRYIEDVVKELRVTDPERRAVAESQFQLCLEMTALLFSEMEAELLQRRGRAAQTAAA
jgi:hypothetical protein